MKKSKVVVTSPAHNFSSFSGEAKFLSDDEQGSDRRLTFVETRDVLVDSENNFVEHFAKYDDEKRQQISEEEDKVLEDDVQEEVEEKESSYDANGDEGGDNVGEDEEHSEEDKEVEEEDDAEE